MRKMMLLVAVVAALGMVSQPTEARDRGFGFRHFSGHAGSELFTPLSILLTFHL
jgi:hypothetical protein